MENRTWDYIDDGLVDEKSEQAGITFFVSDDMIGNETLSTVKSSLSDLKQREKEFDLGSLEMTNIKTLKKMIGRITGRNILNHCRSVKNLLLNLHGKN